MAQAGGIVGFFQKICRFNFGTFEEEEFRKFLRLGVIFAMIIGIYWTLRSLKDSVFIQLVGSMYLPYAKTVSVLILIPMVMLYTKLLEKNPKEKVLVILPSIFATCIFCFTPLVFLAVSLEGDVGELPFFLRLGTQVLGFLWYLFVESFGSLLVALFWAFSTDITEPTHAKRGFPLVVAIGQLGGIFFPYFIGGLPHRLGFSTDVLSMICLGLLTLLIVPLFRYFLRVTPDHLSSTFHGNNEKEVIDEQEPGFLEGLKLVLKNRYLLGIFMVNFIYEVVVTIFDFNFKVAASAQYSGVALSQYLSTYGSSVNIVSLLCLLLGISNLTRFLGVGMALAAMPIIITLALVGFLSINSLSFLFVLMVGSKAINYALNGPALKQLYIPTTPDVKFKAQAWIETFGSRSSKQIGSMFNMSLAPLRSVFGEVAGKSYYLALSGVLCFPLLLFWLGIALFLGKTFKKSIEDETVVC